MLFLKPCGIINELADTEHNIEAWLSLVERCVRDAEVASSNLVASIPACWSSGQDDALSRRKPGLSEGGPAPQDTGNKKPAI